jgi:quercetin dioxygenase-like cupin family protein
VSANRDRVSFLGRSVPACFQVRVVVVEPGTCRPYDEAEWRDAMVVVEVGEIEVEAWCGRCWQFTGGDVLWLTGLRVRRLRNRHAQRAVLTAVSRRGQDQEAVSDP